MLAIINKRSNYDSNLSWAYAEYASIQQVRKEAYPDREISLEPSPKSALFARLLSGKPPLAFPPPVSFKYPWYECVEAAGPFFVQIGGVVPVTEVQWPEHGDLFVNYLLINECPWGIVSTNPAAAELQSMMEMMRKTPGAPAVSALASVLLQRPEWIVKFNPWPAFRVFLGRATHQAHRDQIDAYQASPHTLDGTNIEVTRILVEGKKQVETRAERVAHLRLKPAHILTPVERKALVDADKALADPSAMDLVEYECDAWQIERL